MYMQKEKAQNVRNIIIHCTFTVQCTILKYIIKRAIPFQHSFRIRSYHNRFLKRFTAS